MAPGKLSSCRGLVEHFGNALLYFTGVEPWLVLLNRILYLSGKQANHCRVLPKGRNYGLEYTRVTENIDIHNDVNRDTQSN